MPVNASGDAAPRSPALGEFMALPMTGSLGKSHDLRLGKLQRQISGWPYVGASHRQQQINVRSPPAYPRLGHEALSHRVVILPSQGIETQAAALHRHCEAVAIASFLTGKPCPAQFCFVEAGNTGGPYAAGKGFEPFEYGDTACHGYLLLKDNLYERGKAGTSEVHARRAV